MTGENGCGKTTILRTETSFKELEINKYIEHKIENYFSDEAEKALIERIKKRRSE